MSFKLLGGLSAAFLSLSLVACGDENTTQVTEVNETTGLEMVAVGDSVPECSQDINGQMVYVADSAKIYYCADGEWSSLNGADGEDGADGKDGKDGEDGADGKKGSDGKDGSSCSLSDKGDGSVTMTCGEGDDEISTTLYKAVCGTVPYEPTTHFCDSRNSKIYKYVTIGKGDAAQIWMAENLNVGYNGTLDFCHSDSAKNCAKYGRLYTWAAAMDSAGMWTSNGKGCGYGVTCSPTYPVRGICPDGWHLPSKEEFETLFSNVGGINKAGTMLKSNTEDWIENGKGTDDFGFAALPASSRQFDKTFSKLGVGGYFWSSSLQEGEKTYAYSVYFFNDEKKAYLNELNITSGHSVRCIKN